jgi:small redox-active disulfide protein 2
MKIQVFGPGCAKCAQTEKVVREALAESGAQAEVVKVTDFQEIASYGVFSTPAVAVDGEVKLVGAVPGKNDVLGWLK